MIRDKARTIPGNPLQKEKLATIVKALRVVLRRYQMSRKERRQTMDKQSLATTAIEEMKTNERV